MKISFVYKVDETWNDGLKKAIDVLSERHEVKHHNGHYTNYFADFVLAWGAPGSWQVDLVSQLPFKKGVCLAGGSLVDEVMHKFDVIFVETKWQQKILRQHNIESVLAFGTNTDIFKNMGIPRAIDYLYPAAFAKWKRHELFVKKPGIKVAVGEMQANGHEKECYEVCYNNGVIVMPKVSPEAIAWLYNQSKNVYLPSTVFGGCERAILEATACGCNVEVENDNGKLVSLLEEVKSKGVPNYVSYANIIESYIKEAVNAQ